MRNMPGFALCGSVAFRYIGLTTLIRMKSFFTFALLGLALVSQAQQTRFYKKYGLTTNYLVRHGGDYLTTSNDGLLKIDPQGNPLWAKSYSFGSSFTANVYANNVIATADGGSLTAFQLMNNNMDFYGALLKTDSLGNVQWTKILLPPPIGFYTYISKTFQAQNGDYLVCAIADKGLLMRLNSIGDTIWTRKFDFPQGGNLQPNSLFETAGNDIVVGGYFNNFSSGVYNPFLVRFTASGQLIHARTFDSPLFSTNWASMQPLGNGDILLMAGSMQGYCHARLGASDLPVWVKTYGIPNVTFDPSTDVVENPSGDLVFLAYSHTYSYNGHGQPFMFSTDGSGNTVHWKYVYNIDSTGGKTLANKLERAYDGGYIFGATGIPAIIKTDSWGNMGCINEEVSMSIGTLSLTVDSTISLYPGDKLINGNASASILSPVVTTVCSSFSEVSVAEHTSGTMAVFPNPAQGHWQVTLPDAPFASALLYDCSGRVLGEIRPAPASGRSLIVSSEDFPSGVYFLLLKNENGETTGTAKLIK